MSEFDLNSIMQQAQMLQEKVKYMQKLQQKLGKVGNSSSMVDLGIASESKGKSFIPSEDRSAGSDYTMLKNSKAYFDKKEGQGSVSRWLIKPGLGEHDPSRTFGGLIPQFGGLGLAFCCS